MRDILMGPSFRRGHPNNNHDLDMLMFAILKRRWRCVFFVVFDVDVAS